VQYGCILQETFFMLQDISTKAPKDFDKQETKSELSALKTKLGELQNLLYAEAKHSLLVVIQGMDASGKDGAIKNVFGGINPQGVVVKSYKAPTDEELSHDFLWRIHKEAPGTGMIKIYNRSHYEDVLITRVHGWCNDETATKRFKAINDFEQLLQEHNNTSILKFYLHISPKEQQQRLTERMEDPTKAWKYNARDFGEAKLWDKYMTMYHEVFEHCNKVPWTIVPADQNWYKEYLIAKTITDSLEKLNMNFPPFKNGG
jgi:PPK2 family polyphosphate:nucleotide phosphotransferase